MALNEIIDYYLNSKDFNGLELYRMKLWRWRYWKWNYYDFALVLQKMVVHNISYKTFQKSAPHIASIERKDKNGKDKGSLVMFEEWLN